MAECSNSYVRCLNRFTAACPAKRQKWHAAGWEYRPAPIGRSLRSGGGREHPEPRPLDPGGSAFGAFAWSGKPFAVLECVSATVAIGGCDLPCHALGSDGFGHMGQVVVDLFFADPQRLGEVPLVHGGGLQDGDHLLPKRFHNGHPIDTIRKWTIDDCLSII